MVRSSRTRNRRSRNYILSKQKTIFINPVIYSFWRGVKIGVSEDFNIIIEYGLRKTFTDYIDDVSTTYAGIPSEFDNITIELKDRSLDGPKRNC